MSLLRDILQDNMEMRSGINNPDAIQQAINDATQGVSKMKVDPIKSSYLQSLRVFKTVVDGFGAVT